MVRLTENQWINYFGFQRFPFDRPEAGNEEFARPDFLATCFVEPSSFERVLGQADPPVTSLLFAARGTGKTACRVMVDYYCQRGEVNRDRRQEPSGFVLSVPHIHLDQVLNMARQEAASGEIQAVRVEHHAVEIMRRAVPALTNLVASVPELSDKLRNLPPSERQDLSWLILSYSHYLSLIQANFLNSLGIALPAEERARIGFQAHTHTTPSTSQSPWRDILLHSRAQVSPIDHIAQWAKLIHQLGIAATYVLVDGVDEFEESASDPRIAFAVIRPLLTNLRLMDGTPYLALKFFLPTHIEDLVRMDAAVRRDRGFIFENIVWSKEDLTKILRKRLAALKRKEDIDQDRLETSFDALCVPELRGQIEMNLVHWADGNPRHLMILCGLMVTAHCANDITDQDDRYQLNRRDLETALEQFEIKIGRPTRNLRIAPELNIMDLITQGESDRLEFKASMRWDFKANAANNNLQRVIAKSIAGMLNNEGGVLLIGVADDGTILGIAKDMQVVPRQNLDGFQLVLTDVVKNFLGLENMVYLRIHFEQVNNEWVCAVFVERSSKPVFFKSGNLNEFWVRVGNSTRQLDVKTAMDYMLNHWKEI
jgi:hypothetical protein